MMQNATLSAQDNLELRKQAIMIGLNPFMSADECLAAVRHWEQHFSRAPRFALQAYVKQLNTARGGNRSPVRDVVRGGCRSRGQHGSEPAIRGATGIRATVSDINATTGSRELPERDGATQIFA